MQILESQQYLGRIELSSECLVEYASSLRRLRVRICPKSSPPGQYSSTKYNFLFCWKVEYSLTINGWQDLVYFL